MRRVSVGAAVKGLQSSSLLIALATAGAVAFSILLPSLTLYRAIATPIDPGRVIYVVPLFVCYMPVQTWLVLSAARGTDGPRERWMLAALAAGLTATLPLVGTVWIGTFLVIAGLVLIFVRLPWSALVVGAMVAAVFPITFAFHHRDWAVFFAFAIPYNSVPLAVGVWLIRTARQLQAARLALAEEAIVRERLRIERDLRQTVGTTLEEIADHGDEAAGLATAEPAAAAQKLRCLVHTARGTLADARRMITRYREISLLAELETAVTLLEAAGIRARLVLPAPELSGVPSEERRAELRRDIARLLHEGGPGGGVTIVVAENGRVRFEPHAEEVPTPP